jgi:hypothetical protein
MKFPYTDVADLPNGSPLLIDCKTVWYFPDGFAQAPAQFEYKGLCKIYNNVPRPASMNGFIAMTPQQPGESINTGKNVPSQLPPEMSFESFGFHVMFVPKEDCKVYCEMN